MEKGRASSGAARLNVFPRKLHAHYCSAPSDFSSNSHINLDRLKLAIILDTVVFISV